MTKKRIKDYIKKLNKELKVLYIETLVTGTYQVMCVTKFERYVTLVFDDIDVIHENEDIYVCKVNIDIDGMEKHSIKYFC